MVFEAICLYLLICLGGFDLSDSSTISAYGLGNGDMIYMAVDEEKIGVHEKSHTGRQITKEGNIVAKSYSAVADKTGFRPGMMPLRNMKMHWTLNEFMALDEQFTYRIKRQDSSFCKKVSLDKDAVNNFQQYMWRYDFHRIRVAFLYGTISTAENIVNVQFIYEPPQDTTDISFHIFEDPRSVSNNTHFLLCLMFILCFLVKYLQEVVEKLTSLLGMRKVGWILVHPPREKGFHLSGNF
jgi:nuclear protein localization family protein 4